MQRELTLIPSATIHPDHICLYNEVHWSPSRPPSRTIASLFPKELYPNNKFIQSKRTADGLVSKQAKKKIERAIDYLILLAKPTHLEHLPDGRSLQFKIAFITLTLPSKQIHTDNIIKQKCLNSFLIELTTRFKVKNYVWRAEKQKNGNIHFHLLVDKFIPWSEMRDRWNRIVNKLGYVDRYREELQEFHKGGFKVREKLLETWSMKDQIKAYTTGKANDWNSPNSTDIHKVKQVKNLKKYCSKYMSKNPEEADKMDQEQKDKLLVTGRIWQCNQNLSKIEGARIQVDRETGEEIKRLVSQTKCHQFNSDYFSVAYISLSDLYKFHAVNLLFYFGTYLLDRFHVPLETICLN